MSIIFVYSGGVGNAQPNKSIGGRDSAYIVENDIINNLFSNILDITIQTIDYRCIYGVNDSNNTYTNCSIYLTNTSEGSNVLLGIYTSNAKQTITITGSTGGSLSLNYIDYNGDDNAFTVDYNPNIDIWRGNFQEALNGISTLSGVIVTVNSVLSDNIFTIEFTGTSDGFRSHSLISITDNNLIGSTAIVMGNTQLGGPVNAFAVEPGSSKNKPSGIEFEEHSSDSPIYIGTLYPNEIFAMWFERATNADVDPIEDAAKITVKADIN